jgi:hypothetical protein
MKTARIIIGSLAWIVIAMLAIPHGIPAQDSGVPEQTERFKKEELTQMLAPLALYADSLVAQILMASTYPLEVVEAERWLRQHKELKGEALNNALQQKSWDQSVKSLCLFPDILFAMSENLDQTTKLGDAFLIQEDEVMAVIQELRGKARDEGNLKTTEVQQVIVEKEIVRIDPVDSQEIYVPVYDPLYVYGPWWYPAYPPYYWYYPPGYVFTGGYISYGSPIFIGFGFYSWGWFDWPGHHIYVDVHRTNRFHRHHDERDSGRDFWHHDPDHRRGVAYRDRRTSERFGARPRPGRISPANPETRGYPSMDYRRGTSEPSRRSVERREGAAVPRVRTEPSGDYRRGTSEPSRRSVERREGVAVPRVSPEPQRMQQIPMRDTPFRGIGNGSFERRASERGGESRRSVEPTRPGSSIRQQGGGFQGSGRGGGFRR